MTRQIRTTLLTGLFFFGLLKGLQAQDKYEYAVVNYCPGYGYVTVSTNGVNLEKFPLSKGEGKDFLDVNPALKVVAKMNDEGWELVNGSESKSASLTGEVSVIYIFYLKKKKS